MSELSVHNMCEHSRHMEIGVQTVRCAEVARLHALLCLSVCLE